MRHKALGGDFGRFFLFYFGRNAINRFLFFILRGEWRFAAFKEGENVFCVIALCLCAAEENTKKGERIADSSPQGRAYRR